jgi:hypothetical protein
MFGVLIGGMVLGDPTRRSGECAAGAGGCTDGVMAVWTEKPVGGHEQRRVQTARLMIAGCQLLKPCSPAAPATTAEGCGGSDRFVQCVYGLPSS